MQNTLNAWRILIKSIILFILFEIAIFLPNNNFGAINIYAPLGLLRERFPFSTQAPEDAALDVGNLDAMFSSHVVSQPKKSNEFRIFVLGDSAVWGIRLSSGETLPGQINALDLMCGDKTVHAYNLSFPLSSASKDLMILNKAMAYQPDLVIWLITWNTLSPKARLDNWLVEQNPSAFYTIARRYNFLPKGYPSPTSIDQFYEKQRALFHIFQYQLYSLIQLATGVDQIQYPPVVKQPTALSSDVTFDGLKPPILSVKQVSLDQIKDFYRIAGNTPVLLVNEPMLVMSNIPNGDIRYNEYYPRWIYDQYREYVNETAAQNNWDYLDLWNVFTPQYFTNTPLHLSPVGEHHLAEILAPSIQKVCP